MLEPIKEGCLQFSFPDNTIASKYDAWVFYSKFNSVFGGVKAVDIVHVDSEKTAWLIEIKDYRTNRRTKPSELCDEIALKVRDTLLGLAVARFQARRLRVVLHLEQPQKPNKLFPQVVNPADIKQQLKRLLKAVDAHPSIVDQHTLKPNMLWTVADV